MNRIDRVTAILIHLQSRKTVRAQDIAERFSISLRTVYRDINTLSEAGVPIVGEAGIGYSIMDGYRLPPVQFTQEEATAFLTAEKVIEKFTDMSTQEDYKSAMYKVRSVLRNSEKDMLEHIEDSIVVRQGYSDVSSGIGGDVLQSLLKSIADKQVININYRASEAQPATERAIEPIGVFYSSNYWYTIAWCRLRNDYRNFRTDRIKHIHPTGQHFDAKHPSLKEYLSSVAKEQHLEKVVINVSHNAARYIQTQRYSFGFVSEEVKGEWVQMTFLSWAPDIFARWYIMFADDAEIVSPKSLYTQVKAHLDKISGKISG